MKSRTGIFRWLSVGLFAATISVPLSSAQMRGGMGRAVSGAHTGFGRGVRDGRHRQFSRGIYWGSPFLYSDYDSGEPNVVDNSVENADEGAPPQIVVVRPAAEDSPRKTKSSPLLIEWRGDRYVRFGGVEDTDERGSSPHSDYAEPMVTKTPTNAPTKASVSAAQKAPAESTAAELPPAVLVYRDGHREEISDYAIADGVIYVRANYWQNGYWTKRIALSALDPQGTMQANQQRGVKFMLPSAPNVVIASF